jgi:hypothetical protein
MSKPRDPENIVPFDKLDMHHMIMDEISNAMSSLNMQPSSIPDEGKNGFLSDTDYWCKHSYEHMFTALRILSKYYNRD